MAIPGNLPNSSLKVRETQWNSLWLKPALSTFYSKNEVKKLLEQKDFENALKVSWFFAFFCPYFTMCFCGGKARTLVSTEGFIYLFVRGFACVTWSSAKEPEAGDGKENEREPGDEVGGACQVEIGHIGFWRVVSCGFFLYCFDFSCSCSCSSLQQLTKSY